MRRLAERQNSDAKFAEGAEAFWRKHLEWIDKLIRENSAVDSAIDLLE